MAELEQAPINDCCSTDAQASCCEPSDKATCCGESAAGGSCGCSAGKTDGDVRESVRDRYAAAPTHRVLASASAAIIRRCEAWSLARPVEAL
jgi:hypothetical protein